MEELGIEGVQRRGDKEERGGRNRVAR